MTVYLLVRGDEVALRKRDENGLLAGLWEFPHVPGKLAESGAAAPLSDWGLTAKNWEKTLTARHIFTHVEWRMTGYVVAVAGENSGFVWVNREELEKFAVPSAFAKFLTEARNELA